MVNYNGLSQNEVLLRQKKYGPNLIEEKTYSGLLKFFRRFIQPVPLMIELAMIISVMLGKWGDFFVILLLLSINIIVDYFQTRKTNNILETLKDKVATKTTVVRDGKSLLIDAKELVPGDVIKLNIGDIVPADAKILGDGFLLIDESQITGESLAVEKTEDDVIFSSSVVYKGSAFAKVTKIGLKTEIGKNLALISKAEVEKLKNSHFQKAIVYIVKFLIFISSILVVIVFINLLSNGDSLLEILRFVLVLILASIPVALPVVLSVTLAIGVASLAKKNVIVSNSKAIEELAGVDTLCIDKTGTLTKNQITVSLPKVYGHFTMSDLFTYALFDVDDIPKSPIERAIYAYADEHKLLGSKDKFKVLTFTPFDPNRKMTEVVVEDLDRKKQYKIMIGAPQIIAGRIDDQDIAKTLSQDIVEYSKNGIRIIVVAREFKGKLEPVGLVPMFDPPREDAKSIIGYLKQLGIKVKMLTGDYIEVAKFIANKLFLGDKITNRLALETIYKTQSPSDDYKVVSETDAFAEVVPEDKYKIVGTLQDYDHIVAMTGDGVNDAPALERSNVGIAVSGATGAARASADIVLLTGGLSVIKDALCDARRIFAKMESYATFRIAETVRIIFFITFSLLIFNFSPLSAIMVILLALLNDIPVISIAYDNAPMSKKPIRWKMREMLIIASVLGITGLISSFLLLTFLFINHYPILFIQTAMFLKLDVSGHSTLYLTRTGRKHFWQKPYPSLKFFIPAFGSRLIGTVLVLVGFFMQAISFQVVIFIWIYSTLWFLLNDQVKVLTYRIIDKYKAREKKLKMVSVTL